MSQGIMGNCGESYDSSSIVGEFHEIYGTSEFPAFEKFQDIILSYYKACGRKFPWRGITDPWHIFVSEVMLQQTQTDRVVPFFTGFIKEFPTPLHCADAPLSEILRLWKGLGYNRRARYLHDAAKEIVRLGGVPMEPSELQKLPGIGKATAASVAVYAFDRPEAFIETNVRTVFIHFFFPLQEEVADADIMPLVEKTIWPESPSTWFSAVMDYGVMLKKRYPNPSRRSRHHRGQAPFQGSLRQARGMIVGFLVEEGTADIECMRKNLELEEGRLTEAVESLLKDGLLIKNKKGYSLP